MNNEDKEVFAMKILTAIGFLFFVSLHQPLFAADAPGNVLEKALSDSEITEVAAAVYSDYTSSRKNIVTALDSEKYCWGLLAEKQNKRNAKLTGHCMVMMVSGVVLAQANAFERRGVPALFYQQEQTIPRVKSGMRAGGFSEKEIDDFMNSDSYANYLKVILYTYLSLGV